jgi:hypothetical protein
MPLDFAANTLPDLTSGPLGPWIMFAARTAPNAAVLAFTFVLMLAVLFSLLLWCAGDPKWTLPTVLLVAPVAGLYFALVLGAVIALFGWPILWLFEQIFDLSPAVEVSAASFVKVSYLSIGLVMGTAMAVVIMLLVHGIWTEQRKAHRPSVKVTESGRAELVEVGNRELPKPRDYSRTGEDYRRIGVIVGSIFAAFPIVVGLFFSPTVLNIFLLMYCGFAAVILFLIPYVVSRSLGWLVDNVNAKMQAGTS